MCRARRPVNGLAPMLMPLPAPVTAPAPSTDCGAGTFPSILTAAPAAVPAGGTAVAAAATGCMASRCPSGV